MTQTIKTRPTHFTIKVLQSTIISSVRFDQKITILIMNLKTLRTAAVINLAERIIAKQVNRMSGKFTFIINL